MEKIIYEMVSGTVTHDFVKSLRDGEPFVSEFPVDKRIKVDGVAHCGARVLYNGEYEKSMETDCK